MANTLYMLSTDILINVYSYLGFIENITSIPCRVIADIDDFTDKKMNLRTQYHIAYKLGIYGWMLTNKYKSVWLDKYGVVKKTMIEYLYEYHLITAYQRDKILYLLETFHDRKVPIIWNSYLCRHTKSSAITDVKSVDTFIKSGYCGIFESVYLSLCMDKESITAYNMVDYFKDCISKCMDINTIIEAFNCYDTKAAMRTFYPHRFINSDIKHIVAPHLPKDMLIDIFRNYVITDDEDKLRYITANCKDDSLIDYVALASHKYHFLEIYMVKYGRTPTLRLTMIDDLYKMMSTDIDDDTNLCIQRAIMHTDEDILTIIYERIKNANIYIANANIMKLMNERRSSTTSEKFIRAAISSDYDTIINIINDKEYILFTEDESTLLLDKCSSRMYEIVVEYLYR